MSKLGINEFLGHRTSNRGRAGLSKWKDREGNPERLPVPLPPRAIDVVLSQKTSIYSVWRHQCPIVRTFENKDGDSREMERKVWTVQYVCYEDEEALRAQYKRDDSGKREVPLSGKCGICNLIEWVYQRVRSGKLKWTQPVFRFSGDEDTITLNAAGLYNGFNGDLDATQKKELRKARIFVKDAWKQNMMPKASYVFVVADYDNPADGLQVAVEPALLGDKVKSVINDRMQEDGTEEGNPLVKPYVIRWIHRPNEKEFGKKYHAAAMVKMPVKGKLLKLVRDSNPPDVSQFTDVYNPKTVRALLERACLIKTVPWDKLFGECEAEYEARTAGEKKSTKKAKTSSAKKATADKASAPAKKVKKIKAKPAEGDAVSRVIAKKKAKKPKEADKPKQADSAEEEDGETDDDIPF